MQQTDLVKQVYLNSIDQTISSLVPEFENLNIPLSTLYKLKEVC